MTLDANGGWYIDEEQDPKRLRIGDDMARELNNKYPVFTVIFPNFEGGMYINRVVEMRDEFENQCGSSSCIVAGQHLDTIKFADKKYMSGGKTYRGCHWASLVWLDNVRYLVQRDGIVFLAPESCSNLQYNDENRKPEDAVGRLFGGIIGLQPESSMEIHQRKLGI